MVQDAPHLSPPSPEPTLDAAWRAAANSLPLPGIVACIISGLAGAVTLATAHRLWPVAAACVVLVAFGAYAAVAQPGLGGNRLHPRTQRLVAATIGIIAVLAGLATGLLLLAAIFGGSIEVMRH